MSPSRVGLVDVTGGLDGLVPDWDAAESSARDEVVNATLAAADSLHLESIPDLPEFLRAYYRGVAVEELQALDSLDLLGIALSHRRAAERRPLGECLVNVFTPTVDEHGWSNGHTVIEVVTEDMPFLVDSVSAALSREDRAIHMVIHPLFDVRREPDGRFVSVTAAGTGFSDDRPLDAVVESWLHFDIDRETGAEAIERLRGSLTRVLADVRAAVEDWPAMRETADSVADNLVARQIPGVDPVRQAETVEFIRWLAVEHFTFLGYREYDLVDTPKGLRLSVHPGTGRGILRGGDRVSKAFKALPEEVQRHALEPDPLILTKANTRSTVHRAAYLDYVGIKRFDRNGAVIGEHRFLGLYTAAAYNQSIMQIPVMRSKVRRVLASSGFAPDSHSGKDLLQFLETYPRDELFQADSAELLPTAMAVLRMQERRRTRLFPRRDPYGRFVSCLVYLPRDRYTTLVRQRMEEILSAALNAQSVDYTARVTESVLARLHFVIRGRPGDPLPSPDIAALECELARAAHRWDDDFTHAVEEAVGEEDAGGLIRRFARAIPEAYKEAFPVRMAVADVRHLDVLAEDATELNLYRPYGKPARQRRLKIYRRGEAVSLSRLLPVLQSLGVDVTDERPFEMIDDEGREFRIYDLGLVFDTETVPYPESIKDRFEEAFIAAWSGRAEVDGLNALVLAAGLEWQETAFLRALTKYARQARVPFSRDYIEQVLLDHADVVRQLVDLFHCRFVPDEHGRDGRAETEEALRARITEALDATESLDVDQILRMYLTLITSCVRTSYHRGDPGTGPFRISFKFRPRLIEDWPRPRPEYEIWVYSPRVEGVHLRFGAIARGGLRWSDRPEDFRTEVLGLAKAQAVKNAVIVPAGAKGGFFPKQLPDPMLDRTAWQQAGRVAYREFVCGLLDLTDNRVDGEIVPPDRVVRHDGDDPYLVVAADKGTAQFSDLANEVAAEYGFWLGDAFAAGGSAGYDHKAMGITARGAWESVKRHFRELGVDPGSDDFTCVGIGDMSGDVFGNGMLLSDHILLVAAFDHRHVFLDPQPDPVASLDERRRLFALPRSSWRDYNSALISDGGGVFPRTAKSIEIAPGVRAVLGLPAEAQSSTPDELIRAMLRAPVDLLWNGGIGTYVKSSLESNAEAGDKGNDGVRVNGADLRCRVVAEGGNLGLTQRGRIEAAEMGVRLNTDAIDNSAGVDTSDHEVNIKILLDGVVARGDLTIKQRNELLHEMTDPVSALVLRDNYEQNLVLENARAQAASMLNVHARMIADLVERDELDRALEFLPDEEQLQQRRTAGVGLRAPELAVLLAYSKLSLVSALRSADVSSDAYLRSALGKYFPEAVRDRFADALPSHPLASQILVTRMVNDLVSRGGVSFAFRVREETAASALEIVRGFTFARDVFSLSEVWERIEELDNRISADVQRDMFLEIRRLLDRGTRWWVQSRGICVDLGAELDRYRPLTRRLTKKLPDLLRGAERERLNSMSRALVARGVPEDLALDVAGMLYRFTLLDVIQIARRTNSDPDDVAWVYFCVSERYEVDEFLTRISGLPRDGRWQALARQALRGDLYHALAGLTTQIVRATSGGAVDRLDEWESENRSEVARVRETLAEISQLEKQDLASLSVALRAMRTLVAQVRP